MECACPSLQLVNQICCQSHGQVRSSTPLSSSRVNFESFFCGAVLSSHYKSKLSKKGEPSGHGVPLRVFATQPLFRRRSLYQHTACITADACEAGTCKEAMCATIGIV